MVGGTGSHTALDMERGGVWRSGASRRRITRRRSGAGWMVPVVGGTGSWSAYRTRWMWM
jgi:hypothetical protein